MYVRVYRSVYLAITSRTNRRHEEQRKRTDYLATRSVRHWHLTSNDVLDVYASPSGSVLCLLMKVYCAKARKQGRGGGRSEIWCEGKIVLLLWEDIAVWIGIHFVFSRRITAFHSREGCLLRTRHEWTSRHVRTANLIRTPSCIWTRASNDFVRFASPFDFVKRP